ncbi:MAG: acyl-CoA dehydratase activase-related protein [Firmicutes bacterium]|nr:acyl-CoA dehydratase activase-related protein [Bacillota bacterium]
MYKIGLDVGSTTIKAVVLDNNSNIVFKDYFRHFSKIEEKVIQILSVLKRDYSAAYFSMSGSAGMGLANTLDVPFVQEVYATKLAIDNINENVDVAIELGGEDAKILFMSGGLEVRMNGTCAGGTGAFIDQTASLLGITSDKLNELAKNAKKIYPIASRCGVFAKTDIQPLLNQGADIADLSKSILYAIVDQTIGGLAQGRKIEGNIVYLGGPLTFISSLRDCFDEILNSKGVLPDNSLYFVAMGTASLADKEFNLSDLIKKIENKDIKSSYAALQPLFKNEYEYNEFKTRHDVLHINTGDLNEYIEKDKKIYLGVDSGSTTIKIVLTGEDGVLLKDSYSKNLGSPVTAVKEFLLNIYNDYPDLKIYGGAATGYGEELIVSAFNLSGGVVETSAHFFAAKKLMPDVDFVIDIGGQDMKCFKIKNQAIDDIFLNEACSSGCGSFLQTIADTLEIGIAEFSNIALLAPKPVDLGSRCTVFMNSSIKQAQKDGVTQADIAAGLAFSVIRNALYKVIRIRDKDALGTNIIVQGGTFLSDAVLRAFELEMGFNVLRPNIAGLMGAYGAALYSMELEEKNLLSKEELENFNYSQKEARCNLCTNHCALSITTFSNSQKFISGNKCTLPINSKNKDNDFNIFDYKLKKLQSYSLQNNDKNDKAVRGKIGLPFQLNMFEMLPFWHAFFTHLNFDPVISPISDSATFRKGQSDIPSDTVCYPAKLVHGHINHLINQGIDSIFYPCLSYNFDEKISNNHYNCPVVAYYPQVIGISKPALKFFQPFIDLNNMKTAAKTLHESLSKEYKDLSLGEIKTALKKGMAEHNAYLEDIKIEGQRIIKAARAANQGIIVLVGRPYHLDPEVNKGIPRLICQMGKAVISEDCLPLKAVKTNTLNQWTYHARLYSAADYAGNNKDMNLVQLVSFGCGVDAVTTDEVRKILNRKNKLYTQLKIDEITNLGAVKIRIKSLLAAID